jgi:putative membrane protein
VVASVEQWASRQWEAVIAVMWGYGAGWGWGAWLAMGVTMVVLWGLVVAGGIVLVRSLAGGRNQHPSATRDALSEAERILADRFVRGEIDEDEFRRRSAVLHSSR